MGPVRKSRSVNKRFPQVNEVSPTKDGDSAKKSSRKRKLSDMLGPHWSREELERFYEAYRKHGKDWKKVAAVVRNRSVEMVEAVYSMNRAYLSLPEGTASVAGFNAMMTDYYANMKDRDSEQESNDGAGTSRKPQKLHQGKVLPSTPKGSDGRFLSQSQAAASDYGCLSLLKKKRTGGSRPRAVGKRTPRFPVAYSFENINGEKYFFPTRKGLKLRTDSNDDKVAHEIALALTEASQRGGSPQVSNAPNRRTDSVLSSPAQSAERLHGDLELASDRYIGADMYGDDIEGSMEADNVDSKKGKGYLKTNVGNLFYKGIGSYGKNLPDDKNGNNQLDDIREACSGTEEGQQVGTERRKFDAEVSDTKVSRSSSKGPRKRSKKTLFRRDELSALAALNALADMSLMMPDSTIENESSVLVKDENDDHVDESELAKAPSASRQKEKRKSSGVTGKGNQSMPRAEAAYIKTLKSGKSLSVHDTAIYEANQASYQSAKVSRKRQKILARKILNPEAQSDMNQSAQEAEARDAGKTSLTKSKRSSQSSSPQVKHAERSSSSTDPRREGSDSTLSTVHVSVMNQINLSTKVRSRRKMQKPQSLDDVKFCDEIVKDKPCAPFLSLHDKTLNLKNKLSNCLSNHRVWRWCAFEWFYSAIDYPWFAKREFVEYLYHVGLGHVPRLTRVEWGVIRSSLGKPRRFSDQFLKEEKEKLNQYRDSVRTHYAELRTGTREGLPTDLARPLSVGQRVIAIYPRTREIHDGSVLTVDHNRCHVQFDRPELGVAFVMDIDCMPLNPLENMPTSLLSQTISVDKFFESFNELKSNGRVKDQRIEGYPKHSLCENLENADYPSHLSPSTCPVGDQVKQAKVASVNVDPQSITKPKETATNQLTVCSLPSTLPRIQAKEADVQALAELTRALDKKEAVVLELRRMNDDVLENQKDGDSSLKDSELFKKQYAAVIVQLNEANEQVCAALYRLRQRNTYQGSIHLTWPKPSDVGDSGGVLSSSDHAACHTEESECHINEIVESSRTKASTMVDIAIQALSSMKGSGPIEIEEAVDYVNDRLPPDDSCMPASRSSTPMDPVHSSLACLEQLTSTLNPLQAPDVKLRNASEKNKAPIPSELISHCVATLFMIQKCTERQFPPADVARILDSAVSSLQPSCSQNIPIYEDIQKCMGIIRNQILALVPT